MACDVCGKTGVDLDCLLDEFQTGDIKQVCSGCGKEVNDHLWKLRELTRKANASFLKRFMNEKRENIAIRNKG